MDIVTHHCPNCGGPLLFEPEKQTFHCEYCGSVFSEKQIEQFEKKKNDNTQKTDEEVEMDLFSCPSCGAEIVTNTTTAATHCYYCHNPVILLGRLSGKYLPDKVIPFQIEKKRAIQTFLDWTKKKKFIPKDFFNQQQIENLTGVYFPYWLVDNETKSEMTAKATRVSIWRVGDIEYTKTKKYQIKRKANISFHELTKNALSKNIPQQMIHSIQPFHLQDAVAFNSHYLSGFQAEKRDLEYEDLAAAIHQEIEDYSKKLLRETVVGYTTISQVKTSSQILSEDKQYVLLPVWIVTYRNKNNPEKIFYYAMNGQTGKVSGVLPLNKLKLSLFALGVGVVATVLALIGGYFL